jgi:glucose/arabinose dehydrogenase
LSNQNPLIMKVRYLPLVILMVVVFTASKSQPQLELQPFASGLESPIGIMNAGDDRLFVIQQRGLIRIIDPEGNVSDTPFLDLSGTVSQTGFETGLLGLAFHPDYSGNGYFFVNYTRETDGNSVISRFSVSDDNPDLADPGSEQVLLTVTQPLANHNGGQVLFGPDGYLYIALGDGGGAGDPGDNGQDPTTLLGKMLRIDVDGGNGNGYSIPPDNPFIADETTPDEIWALGLRNPWRNSFDRYTGDFWIADVGQADREEVNFQPADSPGGENYGWRCYEGTIEFNPEDCDDPESYVFPVFEYGHPAGTGCTGSITGGYVYRGAIYGGMFGVYLAGDYCTGVLYYVNRSNGEFEGGELITFDRGISSFGEDRYGELYVALIGSGEVLRVTETEDCNPVAVIMEADRPLEFVSGESLTLEAFFHPSLGYQWNFNDEPLSGETDHTLEVIQEGAYTVTVTNPANMCAATSEAVEVTSDPTSVITLKDDNIFVFPNPATEHLRIVGLEPGVNTTIELIDTNGAIVYSASNINTGQANLSVGHIPAGLYLVRISYREKVVVKRIMIR